MAASHSFIPLSPRALRTLSFPTGREVAARILPVLGFRRILLALACPRHAWNWPRTIRGERLEGFDAHQTCFKCNTERFYDTRLLQPGPLYRVRVAEPEKGSNQTWGRPWGKLLAFPSRSLGARLRIRLRTFAKFGSRGKQAPRGASCAS
jgi:hypothetical protein